MRDSSVIPSLRLASRAPSARARRGAFASMKDRFGQLDRVRQLILIGLAVLAMVVIAATTAYALVLPGVDATTQHPANVPSSVLPATNSIAVVGQPTIAGQYVLSDISTNTLALDLHVFGANVTGTLTTQDCAGHPATAVVTGHFINATALMLTVAQPQVAHATTILYTITHTDEGFSLTWRDAAGQAQVQHWMTATRGADNVACQMVP